MSKEKSIEVLNTLLEINNDRVEGYEKAATQTEDEELKTLFTQFAGTSKKCRQELSSEITKLGGTSTDDTKVEGKVFRVWMDVKTVLTGNSSRSILNSCKLGEESAVAAYENAITNRADDLTDEQKRMVQTHYALILSEQSKVVGMRETLVDN